MHVVSVLDTSSVYLKPGELVITQEPCRVTTVLGSCLSVTMFFAPSRIAALCHAVLPSYQQIRSPHGIKEPFHYVDSALQWMVAEFARLGVKRTQIEVKMFGGASMFSRQDVDKEASSVGRKNIEAALVVLQREGLRLNAWNVGGNRGRKLIFDTHSGEVLTKLLNNRITLNPVKGRQRGTS